MEIMENKFRVELDREEERLSELVDLKRLLIDEMETSTDDETMIKKYLIEKKIQLQKEYIQYLKQLRDDYLNTNPIG